MQKSFPYVVGVPLIIFALLLGCAVLLRKEQKETIPPRQTNQALSTSTVPAQSEATNNNSSSYQQSTSTASGAVSVSSGNTVQAPSSKPQCADGEEFIMVPTSTEFTVPADQEGPFCFRRVVGAGLDSPDGKWTAAIESDAGGPILYESDKLPVVPYDKYGAEGSVIYDGDLSILFTNLVTGEK